MRYVYRGYTTGKLYSFMQRQAEDALNQIVVNSETALYVNMDGSIARGVAGPSPTIYDAGATYSTWEQHT